MSKSVEEKYFQDFGNEDYDSAIVLLWETHCSYGKNGSCPTWPPTLEQVKEKVKSIEDARAWNNDTR